MSTEPPPPVAHPALAARVLTPTPNNEGVDAAVAAARRVIAALLHAGDGTEVAMNAVAQKLTAVADHLDLHAPPRDERMIDMWAGEGVTRHDPVTGPENAIAPPLRVVGMQDGAVQATVCLGLPYQGPPGCVHGGVAALLLDHVLGVANSYAGVSGMTGTLTLRYQRPTPLHEELVIRGQQTHVAGRKISTSGTISARGEVCVSAEGLFINKHLPRPPG